MITRSEFSNLLWRDPDDVKKNWEKDVKTKGAGIKLMAKMMETTMMNKYMYILLSHSERQVGFGTNVC